MSKKKKPRVLPKFIDIGTSTYTVEHTSDMGTEDSGECETEKKIIKINKNKFPDLDSVDAEATLIHEILHGALHELGWDAYLNDNKDEMLVQGLENILRHIVTLKKEIK